MHSHPVKWVRPLLPTIWAVGCAFAAFSAGTLELHGQQTPPETQQRNRARLTGRVVDAVTNQPLAAANIFILGTPITATTGPDGRFVIASAPTGIFTIEAKRLGYGADRFENTRLRADSVTVLEFKLRDTPMRLDQVTVSGTINETSVAKSTITVDKLTAEDLPVPTTTSVAGAVMGKVAGVAVTRPSGAPGSGVNIVLRTPISGVTQSGSPPSPLFVVDGVFLNSQQQVSTQDIESMDVASIEVIKGAAAASLYGSRAAAGVIAITTNRGKGLALGTTQFELRTEYGFDQFQTTLEKNQHHSFMQDAAGNWLNATGDIVPRAQRAATPLGIMDQPYTSPLYNQAKEFFKPGGYNTQTATVQGNSAATNYVISYSRNNQPGVLEYNQGYKRQSIRVNVDSRINEKLSVGLSANHSRGINDAAAVTFNNFYRIDPDVNLKEAAPFPIFGFPYKVVPDSVTLYVNPLFQQYTSDNITKRSRTLINANGVYRPYSWLSIAGDANYDRGDLQQVIYTGRGTPTVSTAAATAGTVNYSTGSLRIDNDITDGYLLTGTASLTKGFRALTVRLSERGEVQRESNPYIRTTGTDFATEGVKNMSQAKTKTSTQTLTDRRSIGAITNLGLTYNEKYIGDFLIRREGNSLFGRANRWNTFGRASGAWVLSEESWFPVKSFNTFKLRYSYGITGLSPAFASQYEVMTSDGSGGIRRSSLGNLNISPTSTREQEIGADMSFKSRVSASLVYTKNASRDVFVAVPAPAFSGYETVTKNTATLTGNITEATIQGSILTNPRGLQWTVLIVASRQNQFINKFGRTCFADGLQYKCEGARLSEMWGNRLVADKNSLPKKHDASGAQFDVNDEGWVVPVGTGNTWRDGVAKKLWGSTVLIDGTSYAWGRPIPETDKNGQLWYGKIGDSNPGMSYGFNNNFRYKNARFYVQVAGQFGGSVYSNSNQYFYTSGDAPVVDNFGRADELKKPVAYYNALANNNNLYLANFVESGTYANLSEMLLGYTFDSKRFGFIKKLGVNRLQVDLVGRNLATFTRYTGLNVMAGSPTVRLDDATYPLTRTWSGVVTLTF
jgi:TonB-linked SusC/RagA family outer membrane protein